jgi:hypothetical protein
MNVWAICDGKEFGLRNHVLSASHSSLFSAGVASLLNQPYHQDILSQAAVKISFVHAIIFITQVFGYSLFQGEEYLIQIEFIYRMPV